MSYTAATTTEIQSYGSRVEWKLELKTNFAGSNTFVEYGYESFTLTQSATQPDSLSVTLINSPGVYSDETDQTNRTIIGAIVKLTCLVGTASGTESTVKFYGKIKTVTPTDYTFSFTAADDSDDYNDHDCEVTLTPDTVTVVDDSSYGVLALVDGTSDGSVLGQAFGMTVAAHATAFDAATGTRRRSWSPAGLRLWENSGSYVEVPSAHWRADVESGAMSILENISGKTYYIQGLDCYVESAASGATNVDLMRIFEQAWSTSKAEGGMGLAASAYAHAIIDAAEGTDKFTIDGDYTLDFPVGKQFYVFDSTGNDGTYTVKSVTLTAGDTVIETNEDFTDATDDGYINPDIGLDISGEVYFRGRVIDLIEDVRKKQQINLIVFYDSEDQKHKVRLVEQKASGSEDHTLYHAVSIDQGRESRDIATRIVATGQSELPFNILAYDGATIEAGEDAVDVDAPADAGFTNAGTYHKWDKTNGGANEAIATSKRYLYDGDHGLGLGAHSYPGSAPGLYTDYQPFIKVDMGAVRRVQRIRAKMPPTANPNASNTSHGTGTDFVYFWPGLQIQISEDNSNWYDIAPALSQVRHPPGTLLDVKADEITHPKGRYLRVYVGPYKQGFSNQSDPSGGLLELEVYVNDEYRIVKEIYPYTHAVAGASIAASTISFADATDIYRQFFPIGAYFEVYGSAANDAVYQVVDNSNDATNTILEVASVAGDNGGGYLSPCYLYTDGTSYRRVQADLYTRFGGYKTHHLKLSNRYNEFLAHDVALNELAERIRMFQQVKYTAVCDPRIKPWQTVVVTDELNGDIGSILIDGSVTFTPQTTAVSGTNYLAEPLGVV